VHALPFYLSVRLNSTLYTEMNWRQVFLHHVIALNRIGNFQHIVMTYKFITVNVVNKNTQQKPKLSRNMCEIFKQIHLPIFLGITQSKGS